MVTVAISLKDDAASPLASVAASLKDDAVPLVASVAVNFDVAPPIAPVVRGKHFYFPFGIGGFSIVFYSC